MNESKVYLELEKREKEIQGVIFGDQKKLGETKQTIADLKSKLDIFWEDMKAAVLESGEKSIKEVEKAFEDTQRNLKRSEALVEGIKERIQRQENELKNVVEERNKTFGILVRKWLEKETETYDRVVSETIKTVRRLLVSHNLCREADQGEVYKKAIGEGYEFLSFVKLPILKDFDRQGYLGGSPLHAGNVEIASVREEILNQK